MYSPRQKDETTKVSQNEILHITKAKWKNTRILGESGGEITSIRTTDFQDATWMQTSLLCEKAHRFTNAKTFVFSDSVLCVGKMAEDPIANWKRQIQWFAENNHFQRDESDRWNADGVRVVNIPRFHSVGHPRRRFKKMLTHL